MRNPIHCQDLLVSLSPKILVFVISICYEWGDMWQHLHFLAEGTACAQLWFSKFRSKWILQRVYGSTEKMWPPQSIYLRGDLVFKSIFNFRMRSMCNNMYGVAVIDAGIDVNPPLGVDKCSVPRAPYVSHPGTQTGCITLNLTFVLLNVVFCCWRSSVFYLKLLKRVVSSHKSAFESNTSAPQRAEANRDFLWDRTLWLV